MEVKTTTIIFDQRIKPDEIGAFRGALLTLLPDDPILHNHNDGSVLYRYPKVQYKIINGMAGIIGIAEGADILESELATGDELSLIIGRQVREFIVSEKTTSYFRPDAYSEKGYRYKISKWLPLNQENHATYIKTASLKERIAMLDGILTINILAAHKKGMGHILNYDCISYITEIYNIRNVKYKGVDMLSFDVEIFSNTPLPEHAGIGKGSARGHGTINRII